MKNFIRQHWVLIVALTILWVVTAELLLSILRTNGRLVFAIDDPYLHMATARNLVKYGVWGVTRYEFSSSNSSILWVLLLAAGYLITGVSATLPLVLNILFASLTVYLVDIVIRQNYSLPPLYRLFVLLGIIFFTPLLAMIFTGMEHTLHIFLTLLFAYYATQVIMQKDSTAQRRDRLLLFCITPLLTLTRYEGLFIVGIVSLLLLWHRQWRNALLLCVLAILPLLIYGIISVTQGWYWLPNSVLLKGRRFYLNRWSDIWQMLDLRFALVKMFDLQPIFILFIPSLILCILQFKREWAVNRRSQIMLVITLLTILVHLQLADTGWFYRYEAYLIALGFFTLATAGYEYLVPVLQGVLKPGQRVKAVVALLVGVLFLMPLYQRARESLELTPRSVYNINEQHYQIGLFLRQFYQREAVALHDVGAPNYLADIRCVDLWGLCSMPVAQMKRAGRYDTPQVAELTNYTGAKIAIVYNHWFDCGQIATQGIPAQWKLVGQWSISDRIIADGNTVSFYAIDKDAEAPLIANLQKFSRQLPRAVQQEGKYLERAGH